MAELVKSYLSLQSSSIYHTSKHQKYPERHFLDSPQRVTYQSEINLPGNIEIHFTEV